VLARFYSLYRANFDYEAFRKHKVIASLITKKAGTLQMPYRALLPCNRSDVDEGCPLQSPESRTLQEALFQKHGTFRVNVITI